MCVFNELSSGVSQSAVGHELNGNEAKIRLHLKKKKERKGRNSLICMRGHSGKC